MLTEVISILTVGLTVGTISLLVISKLAILQHKDYLAPKIFADKRVLLPRLTEILLVIPGIVWITLPAFGLDDSLSLLVISFIVSFIYLCERFLEIYKRRFLRPKLTPRLILNFSILLVFIIIGTLISPYLPYLFAPSTLVFVMLINEFTKFPVFTAHRFKMRQAKRLLHQTNTPTVGITGSYGKTTTKLFLNQILEASGSNALVSPGSINTDIGLAQFLLTKLPVNREKLQAVVLEMDSYLPGTITRIVDHYPLDIAMITGLNEQHIDFFKEKSIDSIVDANYEIFSGLKENGMKIGIFNLDNPHAKKCYQRFEEGNHKETLALSYGADKEADLRVSELSTIISPGKSQLKFKLSVSPQLKDFETIAAEYQLDVLGEFNATNFAGAALIALLLGVEPQKIRDASKLLYTKDDTLNLRLTADNIELIDDTFNANPDSIRKNIEIVKMRDEVNPTRNVLIFSGLYDLGEKSAEIHAKLAPKILETFDYTIVTNSTYRDEIVAGLDPAGIESAVQKIIHSRESADLKSIMTTLDPGDSNADRSPRLRLLACGRPPANIYKYLQNLNGN